jgi:ketosteroid isomerase-like protein
MGIGCVLAFPGCGPVASAQSAHVHKEHKRDYKREIEAVEQQWRTAQLAGDVATMDRLLAEERLQNRMLVFTRIDILDMKIKLVGRVGIVTSLAQVEGTNEGVAMKGSFRYTRVYKRYPDGSWKITNFEVTRVPGKGELHTPSGG